MSSRTISSGTGRELYGQRLHVNLLTSFAVLGLPDGWITSYGAGVRHRTLMSGNSTSPVLETDGRDRADTSLQRVIQLFVAAARPTRDRPERVGWRRRRELVVDKVDRSGPSVAELFERRQHVGGTACAPLALVEDGICDSRIASSIWTTQHLYAQALAAEGPALRDTLLRLRPVP